MKTITCLMLTAILFCSCYKDKGNYDYIDDQLNRVAVSFNPAAVEKQGVLEIGFPKPLGADDVVKRVETKIDQSLAGNLENLLFTWIVTDHAKNNTKDTLYTKGYIDLTLYGAGKNTNYGILLKITDKTTTLETFYNISVKTRLLFLNSWFVLHGKTASAMQLGNVEHIEGSNPAIVLDANKHVGNDENIFANATDIFYSTAQYQRRIETPELIGVATPEGITPYYPFGLKKQTNLINVMFPVSGGKFELKEIHHGSSSDSYAVFVGKNGRFLVGRGAYMFFEPEKEDGIDNYAIEKACFHIDKQYAMLWDRLNQRFLYNQVANNDFYMATSQLDRSLVNMVAKTTGVNIDYSGLSPDDRPMGKTPQFFYGYGNSKDESAENGVRCIFSDAAGNAYAYKLAEAAGKGGKDGKDDGQLKFNISGGLATSIGKVNANTHFAYSEAVSNMLFYTSGNRIYRYNWVDGTTDVILDLSGNNQLKSFRITDLEFRLIDTGPFNSAGSNFYLGIALSNDTEGVLKEVKLTRSGDVDMTYPDHTYPGFAPIKQIVFGTQYLNI